MTRRDTRAIGDRLRTLREMTGLSMRDAAELMPHVSASYVNLLERGGVDKPSVYVLQDMANLYGVDLAYLIDLYYDTDLSGARDDEMGVLISYLVGMDERGKQIAERLIRDLYESFTRPDEPLQVA